MDPRVYCFIFYGAYPDVLKVIDLLLTPRWMVPIVPANTVLENCSVAIDDGHIVGILPTEEALRHYLPEQHLQLDQQVLLPGLINAHTHAAMSLLRGFADDQPLQCWLQDHIWPAETRWVGEEFVRDGTELAMAEMIRSGTTCFADMYFFPDHCAEAVSRAGMRCQLAFPLIDFATAWARDAEEYLHKGLSLRDNFKDHPRISIAFGPHAPYTVSDESLAKIAMLAEELDNCVQIHLHETAAEVDKAIAETGKRPLQRLAELGLLSPLTQCVHMTQVDDEDLALLATSNAHVIHCPASNLKLASGFSPIKQLLDSGINVALGTDGAASNNSLNMFSELRLAALLAKAVAGDACAIPAHQALEMATINGAKALGLDQRIGSIEKGKYADLIAVDLGAIEFQPLYNPLSQLVYTEPGQKVTHAWVQGRALLLEGELQTLHPHELSARARHWQDKISG